MAEREAKLRITTVGAERVRATLQGLTTAVRAHGRTSQDTARATARTVVDTSRQEERIAGATRDAKGRFLKQGVRDAADAARDEVRIAEQTARTRVRITEREARDRRRAQDREGSRAARGGGGSGLGTAMAGAAMGLAHGATAMLSRAQSTAGVGSLEERLAAAASFSDSIRLTAQGAGFSREQTTALRSRVLELSGQTGIRSGEFARALEVTGARFGSNAVAPMAELLPDLAAASQGTGASLEDLVGLVGTAQTAFSLSPEESRAFLARTVQSSRAGAIDARDFAGSFSSSLALFGAQSGRTGLAAAMDGVNLAETIGTGQFGAAESATRMDAVMREFSDPATVRALSRLGVRTHERNDVNAAMLPLDEIMQQLGTTRRVNARSLAGLGMDSRGREAIMVMQREAQKWVRGDAGNAYGDLQSAATLEGETTGRSFYEASAEEYRSGEFGRLAMIGTSAENATISDAERIIGTYRETVAEVTELQGEFPLLNESLGTLTTVVQGLIGALGLRALLGGGGAAAAGGGLLGGGGALAGGGSAAAGVLASPLALGAMAAGGVAGFGYMTARYAERAADADEQLDAYSAQMDRAIANGDTAMAGEIAARQQGRTTQDAAVPTGAAGQAAINDTVGAMLGGGGRTVVDLSPETIAAIQRGEPLVPSGAAGTGAGGAERTSAGQGRRGPR